VFVCLVVGWFVGVCWFFWCVYSFRRVVFTRCSYILYCAQHMEVASGERLVCAVQMKCVWLCYVVGDDVV